MTLPTFIVIGVAKAGTTSLYRYFDQHPDVFMYPEKGTNYFGYEDARDWKWADEGEPPLLRHFRVESFEEYEAGETVLRMRQVRGGGEKMALFTDTAVAKGAVDRLRRAQIEAELRCF